MIAPSMFDTLVTVFGGSGFAGRHLVRALARRGYRIRVAVRRPELAGHLQPLGTVGQIHAVQANLRHRGSVIAAVRDSSIVINLAGILFERSRQRFHAIHAEGAETVARAAAHFGARMIHMSAIGADNNSPSLYAQTKFIGEGAVLAATPTATIFRPSVMFGPEDDFFNRFAALARMSPALPLLGGGKTRFQPVFVGDVAEAIAKIAAGETSPGAGGATPVTGEAKPGAIYELGGPEVLTFRDILEYILTTIERRRLLIPIPFWAARLPAALLQFLPKPLLTPDQIELLKSDNVVSAQAIAEGRTLEGLGISPRAIETIVPTYLWRFRRTGQFRNRAA